MVRRGYIVIIDDGYTVELYDGSLIRAKWLDSRGKRPHLIGQFVMVEIDLDQCKSKYNSEVPVMVWAPLQSIQLKVVS